MLDYGFLLLLCNSELISELMITEINKKGRALTPAFAPCRLNIDFLFKIFP